MIIATLPPLYRLEEAEEIARHPLVDVIRYNVGMDTAYGPEETLALARALADGFDKKLWLDLKGRQLRVTHWAAPNYGKIILNHEVKVEGPARVHFRGSGWTNLKFTSGRTIYVDPPPPQAIGAGQAVNIVGEKVEITGYLTDEDKAYLEALKKMNIDAILLSFVEQNEDLREVKSLLLAEKSIGLPKIGIKIESAKGIGFAIASESLFDGGDPYKPFADDLHFPILARDDLFNELGGGLEILRPTEQIIGLSPDAVAASKFFPSLERTGEVSPSDINDWHLLHQLGYKNFLLQDELCINSFEKAMAAISAYNEAYPEEGANHE